MEIQIFNRYEGELLEHLAMVSSNNDRCEVRPDDSMPEVTNKPNRHIAHPRNAIDDGVQRSGSTTEHGGDASRAQRRERRRLRLQVSAFCHLDG